MIRRDFIKISSVGVIGTTLLPVHKLNLLTSRSVFDKPKDANLIWYDNTGAGRNLYACFRKSFFLSGELKEANLNLFADTAYQLFINNQFVQFGPVRFDPRFPVYDNHDIKRYLKNGKNVIAIQINHFEMKTYKAIPAKAAMLAWGNIVTTGGELISLNSNAKNWKCIPNKAYGIYASRISFALNARDIFNQPEEEKNWKGLDFDDNKWNNAVELSDQSVFGAFNVRSIPFMSGDPVPVKTILNTLPLKKEEDWYSFYIPIPDFLERSKSKKNIYIAYNTWVYSPVKQTITAGVFWSEGWLNGDAIPTGIYPDVSGMRINQVWELKQGWNFYFAKVGPYEEVLNTYIALPVNKGLVVAADKEMNSDYSFNHSLFLSADDFATYFENKTIPFSSDDDIKEAGGWQRVKRTDVAFDVCRENYWDIYGPETEIITPETINGQIFSVKEYPEGFSILFDLDYTHLVIPMLEIEGVKGAMIDVIYSEHLSDDHQHLLQTFNYTAGDRIICSEDSISWMPSHPRGCRYFKITVRHPEQDITIKNIHLRSAGYPVKLAGSFQCSDPVLNEIWMMGVRTQSTNMEDAYVDCTTRERGMYGRDTIIQYHNNLAAFGDQVLMQRCLELYGQSPDATGKFRAVYPSSGNYTISDFALNIVEGYCAYYENSGDTGRIEKDWGAIMKNLAWFNKLADERDDMLLDSEWDKKQKINASYGGFHGDLETILEETDNTGIHCIFSCTYLIALQCALKLANAIHKTDDAEAMQKRIAVLSKSIPDKFWDSKVQAFADNFEMKTHSIHANLFAVRAGITTGLQLEAIKKYVSYHLRSLFINGYNPYDGVYCSPSFAFYILDGLYKAGLVKTAENMIQQGWGWILAQGYKTTPEYFKTNAYGSLCHAWSACPTYYLSKYILGVSFPKAPDMNYVEINVLTSGVTDAEGTYPHPMGGVIAVKWHTEMGKRVFDYVNAPEGVTVKIV